jgi:hypothetical protein
LKAPPPCCCVCSKFETKEPSQARPCLSDWTQPSAERPPGSPAGVDTPVCHLHVDANRPDDDHAVVHLPPEQHGYIALLTHHLAQAMAPGTTEILNTTWAWTAAVIGALAVACSILAFLERPLRSQDESDWKRQIYVCTSLLLLSASLLARAVWSGFMISENKVAYYSSAGLFLSFLSRTSECLQYSSCLVMCWQWALLCGRIVGWNELTFTRVKWTLHGLSLFFWAGYLGSCEYVHGPPRGRFWLRFTRYDDLFVSCKFVCCFLTRDTGWFRG